MKNKCWHYSCIACLLLLLSGACFAAKKTPARHCDVFDPSYNDIAALQETGVLRVAMHDHERPWSWRDKQDNWLGYDADLCRFIAKELGVKVAFTPLHFHNEKELEGLIRQNKIDLASPETPVPINSLEYLLISKPYQTKSLGILFDHLIYNTSSVTQVLQLLNANKGLVGTLDNQQEIRYIQHTLPRIRIVHYRTTIALTAGIKSARVSAIIGSYKELNSWLNKRPARRLHYELLHIPNTSQSISLVTGPQHWRLLQWLNVILYHQEHTDGTLFKALKKKYLR